MNKNSSIAIVAGVAIAIAVIASVFAFSGISNDSTPMDTPDQANLVPQEEKITVLTSFYPYHEFTKNVAGDFADVKQFMPSGVEAHNWEPRAQEIQSLKDADVFVYNGLGMEPYVDQIINSGEFDNVLFVKASDGVEVLKFEDDHDEHAMMNMQKMMITMNMQKMMITMNMQKMMITMNMQKMMITMNMQKMMITMNTMTLTLKNSTKKLH